MSVKPCAFCGGSLDRVLEVGATILFSAASPIRLSHNDVRFLRQMKIQPPDEWLPANARRTA